MSEGDTQYPATNPPGVITWFKIYAGFLSFIYFLVAAASLIFFLVDPAELEMQQAEAVVMGVVLLGLGGVFCLAFGIPLFLAPRPWVWIYDLVIICLGMTSACFWIICIPLLIFWLKPETKEYFQHA
eukprot:Plantae.Rhodophyta-Purpureofilum_apyrenoidigerum.ctg26398.p1 GENE.Plantae.Rhodophyta-Purpureofilum_apyrenoidigerum.ctg26398~~Plantae.Rhodophyta-Purpureofilum_apyrenoidigerum.ctg26398.p1  ORF type:complete len:127 (+),score=14.04 Plantae.Rhodophyta-Purpureofilum_apyrenoidigerum.ctg26398:168-548(+)